MLRNGSKYWKKKKEKKKRLLEPVVWLKVRMIYFSNIIFLVVLVTLFNLFFSEILK